MHSVTIHIHLNGINCSRTLERDDRLFEIVQRNVPAKFAIQKNGMSCEGDGFDFCLRCIVGDGGQSDLSGITAGLAGTVPNAVAGVVQADQNV